MINETDRMRRAGDYVLGRMDAAERERAERDLERDDSFRAAVMQLARTRRTRNDEQGRWDEVAAHLSALPQMKQMAPAVAEPQRQRAAPEQSVRRLSLAAVPGWRGVLVAVALVAAFGLGFLAGVSTESAWRPADMAAGHSTR
jgi:anti-sigma-K factor RskA